MATAGTRARPHTPSDNRTEVGHTVLVRTHPSDGEVVMRAQHDNASGTFSIMGDPPALARASARVARTA